MGVVYEAFDEARGERVALKTLRELDREALILFKSEFRTLADLRHPNLVSLGELVFESGTWFFTMELLSGEDFRRYVRGTTGSPTLGEINATPTARVIESTPTVVEDSERKLPAGPPPAPARAHRVDEARLRSAIAGIAEGLAIVHAAGRAHLDVKPSNVRLTEDGRAVLLDFGLAGAAALAAARPNHVMGTPQYMAPEQALGVLGPEADLYAVGVMLYEALSGWLPFDGPSGELLATKVRSDPVDLELIAPHAPPDLIALTMALLSRDPTKRPNARDVSARARGAEPTKLGLSLPTAFVGRVHDLAALDAAFAEVAAGRAVVVTIEGEAGLGKSALAAEFTQRKRRSENVSVLSGRCYEHESVPYKAFDAIVDEISLRVAASPKRAERLAAPLAAAARVFPVLEGTAQDAPRTGDDVETRRLAFAGLRAVLVDLAHERPLLMILDDVQWGDEDSARLLEELLDPIDAPAMMIIATQRPVQTPNALLSVLRSNRTSSRHHLVLPPLGAADAQLAALLLGAQQSDAAAIARGSQGNPLLLAELLRYVAAGGAADGAVSVGVALLARVRALPEPAQRLLEMVAIAGRPTSEAVLGRASGLEGELREAVHALLLGALVRRGGVRSPDALEPAHDRVRESVSGSLDDAARMRLHRALAGALAAEPRPEADALAEHLAQAGDVSGAARWARPAADACEAALAFGRAVRFHQLTLADPSLDSTERRALTGKLGHALASAGRGREAADAFLSAASTATPAEAVAFRQRAAEQLLITGHMGEGRRVLEEVLAEVSIYAPQNLASSLAMFMLERGRLGVRGLDYQLRAEGEVSEGALLRIDACLAAARALSIINTMQGAYFAARQLRMALDAGEAQRIVYGLALSCGFQASAEGSRGESAQGRLDRAVEVVRASGVDNPRGDAFINTNRGVIAYCRGDWQNAVRWCREAGAILETRCTSATWDLNVSRIFTGLGLGFSGELATLEAELRGWMKDARSRGDLYLSSHLRLTSAPWVFLARGDVPAARAEIDGAADAWPHKGFSWARFYGHFHTALLALYEGDIPAAERAIANHRVWPSPLYLKNFVMHRLVSRWATGAIDAARFRQSGSTKDRARVLAAVRELRRANEPWARGLASALEAATHAQDSRAHARERLRSAERELTSAGMHLFADAAAHEAARLDDDTHRTASVELAKSRLAARGVADPARLARTLIPGL